MQKLVLLAGLLAAGCASVEQTGGEDFDRYLAFCRELATGPDELVAGASVTTQEFRKDYKIVYADRDYVSFYATDYAYLGGAHGTTAIRVGTISRKTGEITELRDFVPDARLGALEAALYRGAVKQLGGAEHLQAEVKVIDNFHLAKGGLHFICNQYEIACYAAGAIEVVVDPKSVIG